MPTPTPTPTESNRYPIKPNSASPLRALIEVKDGQVKIFPVSQTTLMRRLFEPLFAALSRRIKVSVKVLARVWAHSQTAGGELLVMLALADHANDAGECWPYIGKIAEKARLSRRQVKNILPWLEELGELKIARSNGGLHRGHRYLICVKENGESISPVKNLPGETEFTLKGEMGFTPTEPSYRTVNNTHAKARERVSSISKKKKQPDPAQFEAFTSFYEAYPRHVGKGDAEKAWLKLNPDLDLTGRIMAAVRRYADEVQDTEPKYIKHPGPWLNSKRWEDEPARPTVDGQAKPLQVKDIGNGMVEVDGRQMDRATYERRYGQQATT